MKSYIDIRLADPFLKPYWRHERVVQMVTTTPPARCGRFDDLWIKTYRKFLYSWRKNESQRTRMLYELPGLYYAYAIHDRVAIDSDMALIIESRLLAGCTIEDIANDCKTIPETIMWYEKLFFNVANFLDHNDWIVKNALMPVIGLYVAQSDDDKNRISYAKPYLDMSLKLFSYFGGPIMCDIMINGFKRNNKLKDSAELEDYINDQFTLQLQRRSLQAVQQFEINKYNVTEIFTLHSRIIELKKSVKNQEMQNTDFEKHVNAMLLSMPWTVGRAGKQKYQDTIIGKYDDSAIELDPEEIVMTGYKQESKSAQELLEISPFENREV